MPRTKEQMLQQMADSGVVAVMRAPSTEILVDVSEALLAGGVVAIEVTMTTPKAIAAIEQLADEFGDQAVVGVGTVIDAATARDAIAAGAQFVLSPTVDPAVIETTRRYGKISVPGAFTPTEILNAFAAGADVVKVFPSTALGPQYFRDLLAPMPQLRLSPTGGVDLKNAPDWIKAGATFLGVGSALVSKETMARRDFGTITNTARAFIDTIRQARMR